MLGLNSRNTVASLVLGIAWIAAPQPSTCATPIKFSGVIAGLVTDYAGKPQMGATVYLFSRTDKFFQKVLTDERGEFKFPGLLPDLYSVKVTLASFVPATRNNVLVRSGTQSLLSISLNGLFSSIQLVTPPTDVRGLMSDDWKWVLRTAAATRPVLRFLPELQRETKRSRRAAIFSETRGMLKVSAGDGGTYGATSSPDLGTAFALATSLFGNNVLQVVGNLGYGSSGGLPAAGFRTSYSRKDSPVSPHVAVTMRQLYLPGRISTALTSGEGNVPALRTMSVSVDDSARITDSLEAQYGFSLDSVSFVDHLNYFSPYVRLVYSNERRGKVEFAFTSGNARPDLTGPAGAQGQSDEFQRDLAALGMFPRISLRESHAKVQRGENYELAYSRAFGSRNYRVSAFHEDVSNAALTMSSPGALYSDGNILPDLFSGSHIFNAGDYSSTGYTASATQNLGEHVNVTGTYAVMGALTAASRELASSDPDDLRAMIRAGRRHSATARIAATSPKTGTHLIASYQWTDHNWLAPGHLYSTSSIQPQPGLNIYLRQPIPSGFLPWRMEITADLRNLLAEGYLPLMVAGQSVTLVQTPRGFRGGLSFIF